MKQSLHIHFQMIYENNIKMQNQFFMNYLNFVLKVLFTSFSKEPIKYMESELEFLKILEFINKHSYP